MFPRFKPMVAGAATLGVVLALVPAPSASAQSASAQSASATPASAPAPLAHSGIFPAEFALPTGFLPEGIAIGALPVAFFGSRADGDIYRANLITGNGTVFSQGPGTPSVGMKVDLLGRLFVAGGNAGDARVVNAFSGNIIESYGFVTPPAATFINDVVVTPRGAYFTDSMNPVLFHLPFSRFGGLPDPSDVVQIPLSGDYQHQPGFNANGISRTPDGKGLIIVQSSTGLLFRVDPATGVTDQVDLGGETVVNGDGLLLLGNTLYVVRNRDNLVTVIRLDRAGTSGTVVDEITDARFDVPTTVAAFGNRLYLPNARFGVPEPENATYNAVAVRRH